MENTRPLRIVSLASVMLAALQSICAAVLAVSGIRLAIGLTALASVWVPVLRFHQDAVRIPMLTLATVGALVNLAVLAWIWRLRGQDSAQWRKREITRKERRSERLQLGMAILTLALVGSEVWIHNVLTHKAEAQSAIHSNASRTAAIE